MVHNFLYPNFVLSAALYLAAQTRPKILSTKTRRVITPLGIYLLVRHIKVYTPKNNEFLNHLEGTKGSRHLQKTRSKNPITEPITY